MASVAASRPGRAPSFSRSRKEAPFEQLLDEVRTGIVGAEVMNREDVGVVEGGRGAGLLLEPAQRWS
jgi:hypothetical protein